jgi:predicted HTH domain antitoxin
MQLSINLPDNIFFGINQTKQSLTQLLKEKLALKLYKSAQISLTQGAKIVSMDIYDFMALLSKKNIAVINDYDIESEVANLKRLLAC